MSERSTKEIHEAALGSAEKKEKNSLKIPGRNFRRMPGREKKKFQLPFLKSSLWDFAK